jgi:hypothetical protein
MTILHLLLGATLAVSIFFAMLWSVVQAVRHRRWLRWGHLGAALATVALFALASFEVSFLGLQAAGGALAACALVALIAESGWTRLLPLIQVAFGGAMVAGLPLAL